MVKIQKLVKFLVSVFGSLYGLVGTGAIIILFIFIALFSRNTVRRHNAVITALDDNIEAINEYTKAVKEYIEITQNK